MNYEIFVGNVGLACKTNNPIEALKEYGEWKRHTRETAGRASGEPVTLMKDGEPWHEYQAEAINHVGQVLYDMHGSGLLASKLKKLFEVRNIVHVDFPRMDSTVDKFHSPGAMFEAFLNAVMKKTPAYRYTNKLLVTVGPEIESGWWPAAYMYDGMRAQICEIKARAQE